jgi:glycosyltransferase involved in cell wall biosynthesis
VSRPRVSVLLPVRDEEPFLVECLESLSAQTLADFEVVAVDDGSTDATFEILEAHARADSRFRVLHREPAGMVAASERARAEARAPLLARMDADDVALPQRLELQVAAIEEEGPRSAAGSNTSPNRPTGCAPTPAGSTRSSRSRPRYATSGSSARCPDPA